MGVKTQIIISGHGEQLDNFISVTIASASVNLAASTVARTAKNCVTEFKTDIRGF